MLTLIALVLLTPVTLVLLTLLALALLALALLTLALLALLLLALQRLLSSNDGVSTKSIGRWEGGGRCEVGKKFGVEKRLKKTNNFGQGGCVFGFTPKTASTASSSSGALVDAGSLQPAGRGATVAGRRRPGAAEQNVGICGCLPGFVADRGPSCFSSGSLPRLFPHVRDPSSLSGSQQTRIPYHAHTKEVAFSIVSLRATPKLSFIF
jgi:hypothetical protein